MPREMTVKEAGKKGGTQTKKRHGIGFYKEIGKKGGAERSKRILEEGITEEVHQALHDAGKKGGETTRNTHGIEFYKKIGSKGGKSRKRRLIEIEIEDGQVTSKYSKFAEKFIEEHNNNEEWSPFDSVDNVAIRLFAQWLDKNESK